MRDVVVVEVSVDTMAVERIVEVTSVVRVSVTVEVLEKMSVVAAAVVVTVVDVCAVEVTVIPDAVTVTTGLDSSRIRVMSGRSRFVLVEVGIGAFTDELP